MYHDAAGNISVLYGQSGVLENVLERLLQQLETPVWQLLQLI